MAVLVINFGYFSLTNSAGSLALVAQITVSAGVFMPQALLLGQTDNIAAVFSVIPALPAHVKAN